MKALIERLFSFIEKKLLDTENLYPEYPPIFILGLPRTGSTLLLQLLIQRYKFYYFTNFTDRFHGSPIVSSYIESFLNCYSPKGNYSSYYGRTKKWNEPHDGTKIWSKWLPYDPVYLNGSYLNEYQVNEIRNTISRMEKIYKCPFVNKAQKNNGRILEFNKIFPNCLFVVIERDLVEVIISVSNGFKNLDKKNTYFSSMPSNWGKLSFNNDLEAVCNEMYYTQRDIERDLSTIENDRKIFVTYENLCKVPQEVLNGIADVYKSLSEKTLHVRNTIPKEFERSKKSECSKDVKFNIEKVISSLENRDDR